MIARWVPALLRRFALSPAQPVNVVAEKLSASDDGSCVEAGTCGSHGVETLSHGALDAPTVSDARLVGRSLPRLSTMMVTIAGVAVALFFLNQIREFVAPIFFALNMIIAGYPVHRFLVKRKCPAWLAATVAGVTMMIMLIAIAGGLIWSVAQMIGVLPSYQQQFIDLYKETIAWLGRLGLNEAMLLEQVGQININFDTISSVLGPVLSSTGGAFSLVGVIVMAMLFMMMDTAGMSERVRGVSVTHPRFGRAMADFTVGVRRYWLVTTVFGLIVAVLDGAVLLAVGVPLPLVWTLFSFLTNYIPNVGFIIGLVPPALLALVDGGMSSFLIVVIAYICLNYAIQGIIQPRYTGDAVGVTPTVSFLSLMLWGWVLGALGTILALPCTLLIKALFVDADPRLRWINRIVSSRPESETANDG